VANGPGERFVLWVQGCPKRCPGCINPDMQPMIARHLVPVGEMADRIRSVPGLEGVTYTGGEPMAQARPLALLSELLRPCGLTIVCYTGCTLEELAAAGDPWVRRLLGNVDILIDGPYLREEAAKLLWRGSRNQRVLFLTDAYRRLADEVDRPVSEVEFTVTAQGFTATGIWPEGLLERLRDALRARTGGDRTEGDSGDGASGQSAPHP